jgi:hypothetical protein
MLEKANQDKSHAKANPVRQYAQHSEPRFLKKSRQSDWRKIPKVFQQQEWPIASQNARTQALNIGNLDKQETFGFQSLVRFLQSKQRASHVLQDIPHRNGIKCLRERDNILDCIPENRNSQKTITLIRRPIGGLNSCNLPTAFSSALQEETY